ncbi:MAG: outer membrane protein assembly factor, partial [Ignavibacterium sp.]|nr:outer membrane protein assembly factor [Ignavibacterium sp.]
MDINERDYKKISYGLYLVYKNFRGRNETIYGSISFGYNPSYGFTYLNPNLSNDGKYFLRFSTSSSKKRNRSITAETQLGYQFDYKHAVANLILGKRLDRFNKIYCNLSFNYFEVSDSIPNFTINQNGIDKYLQFGLGYEYDKRDLIQFPKQGEYLLFNSTLNGLGFNSINHQTAKFDLRYYDNLSEKFFYKLRFLSRLTFGNKVPLYDYS